MTSLTSPLGIDPYGFASTHLSEAARGVLGTLAATLESDVRPLMAEAWETATMPAEVRATLAALRLMDPAELSEAEAASSIYAGFRNFVLARADVSVATAYNAQSGLFRTAVTLGGSPSRPASSIRGCVPSISWAPSPSPSPSTAPTSPRASPRRPAATARAGCSTAPSAGSAGPTRPT
ncbi:hypothetical protein [Homoserinibacter gongjuensis]|uniref:Uncharacterized protein n=1 Tax=Homoserinibacter gongjuensis TaxID=1162968 RepID=A0ABQ6JN45_9MICO|nr:hypothetical protein GCM10025869_02400 [Homoserinibacter gongjuensis]